MPLLDALQAIEHQQGRERGIRWGARTLDLDLLLYGSLVINTARLTLPHPRLAERSFVLVPLADVAPANLMLPDGRDLDTLIRACPPGALSSTADALLPPG
jgi:2-amino-4-hydroxy-6-hydroxymethyldihydropteridine diphosphokinase